MTERDLYHDALDTWGEDAQLTMAQEECSELITEIARHYRGRSDMDSLAEEIADVEIMMAQLRLVVGEREVEGAKQQKLQRLEERLSSSD